MGSNFYRAAWWQHTYPSKRRGVYVVGETPSFSFSTSGIAYNPTLQPTATAYEVRDYYGNVVSSGAVTGTPLVPTPPPGGWPTGWYRVYLTGPNTDPTTGNNYSEATFAVLRDDPRFPANTVSTFTSGGLGIEGPDHITKAVCGMGTTRMSITNAASPSADLAKVQNDLALSRDWWSHPANPAHTDPARPARRQWVAFPNGGYDTVNVSNLKCYVATPGIDGSQVFIKTEAGSVSGAKVTVRYPDASTVVETYDNLTTPMTAEAAMSASAWVKVYGGGATSWATFAGPSAIGRAYWDGVQTVVNALYPQVECFEGPRNEGYVGDERVHWTKLFAGAVKGAQPAAKVLGPCIVTTDESYWQEHIAAAGPYFDEIATHHYNLFDGNNLRQARRIMTQWKQWLADAGCGGKPMWDTESNAIMTEQGGVFHWRRAADAVLYTLFLEQEGIPRERAPFWYDRSHGFWGFPSFWQFQEMVFPHGILYRTLAEETHGLTFQRRVNFGTLADDLFLGSVYRLDDSQPGVLVVAGAGEFPGAQVTFTVTGMTDGTLVSVDALAHESTVTVSGGRLTLTIDRTEATYIRLPAGVSVDYEKCLGWDAQAQATFGTQPGYGLNRRLAGVSVPGISNGQLGTSFRRAEELWYAATTVPTEILLEFGNPYRTDHVMLWFASTVSWHAATTALAGTVEGSPDGVTWVPIGSFDSSEEATSIPWVSICWRETWWKPRWFYDFKLAEPAYFTKVRVTITKVSYGNEPDADCAVNVVYAPSPPKVTVREIMVLCDDNTFDRYVVATP